MTDQPTVERFREAMFSYAPTPLAVLVRGDASGVEGASIVVTGDIHLPSGV